LPTGSTRTGTTTLLSGGLPLLSSGGGFIRYSRAAGGRISVRVENGIAISHATDIVRRPACIPLRALPDGKVASIPHFGIAALRARAMHIHPCAVHIAHRPTKSDVGRVHPTAFAGMGRAAPVERIIGLSRLVGDG
jgi:hypothetical protein